MAIVKTADNRFNIYCSTCEISKFNTIPEITLDRLFGQYRDIYNICIDLWNTGVYTNCKIVNKFEMDIANFISRDIEYRKYLLDDIIKMVYNKFCADKDSSEEEIVHLRKKGDKIILQFNVNNFNLTQNGYVGIMCTLMGKEYELPLLCSEQIPEDFIKQASADLVSVILHEKDGSCELRAVCNNHI